MKAKLIKENLNEAIRYREGAWRTFSQELRDYHGWKDGSYPHLFKYYSADNGEEREIEIRPGMDDDISFTVVDSEGEEIDRGSFDAEGLGSGEFDDEVWNYVSPE